MARSWLDFSMGPSNRNNPLSAKRIALPSWVPPALASSYRVGGVWVVDVSAPMGATLPADRGNGGNTSPVGMGAMGARVMIAYS